MTFDFYSVILAASYDTGISRKRSSDMKMEWTKDQSIRLSLICVWIFAAILLIADVFAFRWVRFYVEWRQMQPGMVGKMMLTLYSASVFGWICLWALRGLLKNISEDSIFVDENVKLLHIISWCCAFAAGIFLISAVYYVPLLIIAVAAMFMMLIVRIVKNVFQKANAMKDELDFTI